MKKRHAILFRLLVTFLFAFACAYSLFDQVREADFLSRHKYEDRDMEALYAEKGSDLDGVLVSTALFLPFPATLFESPPSLFSPNTFLGKTFSALHC